MLTIFFATISMVNNAIQCFHTVVILSRPETYQGPLPKQLVRLFLLHIKINRWINEHTDIAVKMSKLANLKFLHCTFIRSINRPIEANRNFKTIMVPRPCPFRAYWSQSRRKFTVFILKIGYLRNIAKTLCHVLMAVKLCKKIKN